jgi:hypothetical protein
LVCKELVLVFDVQQPQRRKKFGNSFPARWKWRWKLNDEWNDNYDYEMNDVGCLCNKMQMFELLTLQDDEQDDRLG